ncbi:MAG: hypothetical protein ABF289_18605 [Clostridiales bacterium]
MNSPIITSYPVHANVLSIIDKNEKSLNWFINHYIQLFARSNEPEECYVDFYAPNAWRANPFIDYQKIDVKYVDELWFDIKEFIINNINEGYYIYMYLNGYYISNFWTHNKFDYMHDTLIFGYDLEKKIFKTADFYGQNTKYQFNEVRFDEIKKAYKSADLSNMVDLLEGIILMKYNDYEKYDLDIDLIRKTLEEYLCCMPSNLSYTFGYRKDIYLNKSDFAFGLNIYDVLIEYEDILIKRLEKKESITRYMRGFNVLKDHKILMLKRLNIINKKFKNIKFNKIINDFHNMLNYNKIMEFNILKSYVQMNREDFIKVKSNLCKLKKMDEKFTEDLINIL